MLFLLTFLVCCLSEITCASILPRNFLGDEDLDLFCLRLSYPAIKSVGSNVSGAKTLNLSNGMTVPYVDNAIKHTGLNVDVKGSLSEPYPLEPLRPFMEAGMAPGRKRPYELFFNLYGSNAREIRSKLRTTRFNGKNLNLAQQAAKSFDRAKTKLAKLAERQDLKKYLKPDGAFYWRNIAGEQSLSAHSFGIAIDLGAKAAPYWRWSRQTPHPMQQSYPPEIVRAMEDHGFIWGGKWHEYDLMHFEYRPEMLCKARMRKYMRDHDGFSARFTPHSASKAQSSAKAEPEAVR